MVGVSAGDKLTDRNLAAAAGAFHVTVRSQNQQQCRRIGMRLGETKIAAERSRGAHAHIGHLRFQFRQDGLMLLHEGGVLNAPMCGRARRFPDAPSAVRWN